MTFHVVTRCVYFFNSYEQLVWLFVIRIFALTFSAPKDSHQCTACIRTTTLCRARKHVECPRQRRAPRAHAARAHRARAQLQHLRPHARGRRRAGACPRPTGCLPRLCPSVGWRYFARVPPLASRVPPLTFHTRASFSTAGVHPRREDVRHRRGAYPPNPPPPRVSARAQAASRNRLEMKRWFFLPSYFFSLRDDTENSPARLPFLPRPTDQGPRRGVRRRLRCRRADRGLHPRVRRPVPAAQGCRLIAARRNNQINS